MRVQVYYDNARGKIMPIKPREMEKIILADGWELKMQVGSHRHYTHPTRACSYYPRRAGSEAIFRQARRISAGILEVFQGNGTQYGGKSTRIQPLSGSVNTS